MSFLLCSAFVLLLPVGEDKICPTESDFINKPSFAVGELCADDLSTHCA